MTIRESRARLRAAEHSYNTAKPGRDLTEARHELTNARGEYQAECVALVEILDDVLEPFSNEASEWHYRTEDDRAIYVSNTSREDAAEANFNVGDLRRLSSIYKDIADAE